MLGAVCCGPTGTLEALEASREIVGTSAAIVTSGRWRTAVSANTSSRGGLEGPATGMARGFGDSKDHTVGVAAVQVLPCF
jgi:hypothetical protein